MFNADSHFAFCIDHFAFSARLRALWVLGGESLNVNASHNGALMIQAACPSRETLLRYLQGNFDFSQIDSLEEHLEQCSSCEETVAELEDTNDTLMRHLPLAATGKVEAGAERRPGSNG